jgi:hypothetical protein
MNEQVTGQNISQGKNSYFVFESEEIEDCKYVFNIKESKDCYDWNF